MCVVLVVELLIDVDELASAAGLIRIVSRHAYSHAIVEASSRKARKTTNAKWKVCSSLRFDVAGEAQYGLWLGFHEATTVSTVASVRGFQNLNRK